MEYFTLNTMVERAKVAGYKKIIGEYLPTAKNQMVEHHYADLGFEKVKNANSAQYVLDINKYIPQNCYIKMK